MSKLGRVLAEDGLVLYNFWNEEDSTRDCVPPPTPNADYEFSNNFYQFPKALPDITDLNVPHVREIGVKACIDVLGTFFRCKEYKFNLLQFWFLDILTATLWATQDDFHFSDDLQKIVLAWILYFIDLIRDPSKNITRKQFFETFKEAILIASEVVEEGCDLVPTPDKLILLLEQEEEEPVSWKSSSTESSSSSLEINQEDLESTNLIELGDDENRLKYVLPETKWRYQNHDLSSAASSSTSSGLEECESKKKMKRRLKNVEFYKPDLNIPARFISLNEEISEESFEEEESETCMCKMEEENSIAAEDEVLHVHEVPEKFQIESIAESISTLTETADLVSSSSSSTMPAEINQHLILEKIQNKKIMKNLAIQKIREQRIADMANPRKGYIPSDIQITEEVVQEESTYEEEEEILYSEESEGSVDNEWIDAVINQQNQKTMDNEDRQIMNYAVLRAIIDIIIKYFYESFQFTLIKMAFQATPEVICQKINKEWKMPKKNMLGFVRPKEQKPPKAPKAPKAKKEKGDKKKDKGAKGTKDKSAKDKKDKKKEKPKQLTKEEKAELARLQKEQEKLEEEMCKIEENKRFMFPLTDAATDDLFRNIFENWVKADLTKKGQKGKAGKAKK